MKASILLGLVSLAAASPMAKRAEPAPLYARGADLIANDYVVKFKEGSALSLLEEAIKHLPNQPDHKFEEVFKGFSSKLDAASLAFFRNHPDVEYVQQNSKVYTTGIVSQEGALGVLAVSPTDRRAPAPTATMTARLARDFGGRAEQIKSFVRVDYDDCGHGTHVAGTIGSNTYGVSKNVNLFGVKVLFDDGDPRGCTGPNSGVVSGLDFVARDSSNRDCPNGIVVNLSLGGGFDQATNDAVRALTDRGIFVAAAAGNDNQDASNYSPASEPSACTVAGSDINDQKYRLSNYGNSVDIITPAVNVESLWPGGSTRNLSGTSMATPHIVGLAAYIASAEGTRAGPGTCDRIQQLATKNAIAGYGGDTVNLLAFNNVQ